MKYFLSVLISIVFLSGCKNEITNQSSKLPEDLIGITKTEAGFNIYSDSGEFMGEDSPEVNDVIEVI